VAAGSGEAEFWIHDAAGGSPLGRTSSGKVFRGTLRVGDVLHRAVVADTTHAVSFRVDEISLYGTLVDELDTPLSAHVLVSGQGEDLLVHDTLLYRA